MHSATRITVAINTHSVPPVTFEIDRRRSTLQLFGSTRHVYSSSAQNIYTKRGPNALSMLVGGVVHWTSQPNAGPCLRRPHIIKFAY